MARTRIHGAASSGENLTGNLNFYTLYVLEELDITATGNIQNQSQQNLDDVVNLISLVAQPIIMNTPLLVGDLADYAPTLSGSGYIFKFAVEHGGVFARNGNSTAILAELFDGVTIDGVLLSIEDNIEFAMSDLL